MTTVVLVVLGSVWTAVLLPPYLQNRRDRRPGDSIESFRHQLWVIERTTPCGSARSSSRVDPGRPDPPPVHPLHVSRARRRIGAAPAPESGVTRRSELRRRRRGVFGALLGGVGVTLLLAVAMGGMLWTLHLLVDLAFVGFAVLLVKFQHERAARDLKVRFFEPKPIRAVEQALSSRVGT